MIVERPWGTYEVLTEGENFLVKRLVVYPGGRLSYQSHESREEIWHVAAGSGIMTLDDVEFDVSYKHQINISIESKHRIHNKSDSELIIIEIQFGYPLIEEDIIRYIDDYGRIE